MQAAYLGVHVFLKFSDISNGIESRDDDDDDDATIAASVCELPKRNWEGLWNSLIYAGDIKLKLLRQVSECTNHSREVSHGSLMTALTQPSPALLYQML